MLPEKLQKIIDEFQEFNEPEMKYELLIEYGKKLSDFPEEKKTTACLVPGCISVVYITSEIQEGKVYFKGYADALLVKGLVAILVEGLSGMTVENFEKLKSSFLTRFGLNESLTPSRANASVNIFKLMQAQIANIQK